MLVIHKKEIHIPRGEPGAFDIQYTSEPPEDGTRVLFSVKKDPEDEQALIEKTVEVSDGKLRIELDGTDTELAPGDYVWDLVEESGYRPIRPALFTIGTVVGNKGAVMI